MNKIFLSTLAAAVLAGPIGQAEAGLVLEHASRGNAVNYCQAFTPGPSNTIRNRVVGIENVGSAPVAVACAFQSQESLIYSQPTSLRVYTSNTSAQPVSISCTLLVGHYGESDAYLVTKSVSVPAGTFRGPSIEFNGADNPAPLSPTLGDSLIGVNCTLPAGAGLNETRLTWQELL